MLPIKKEMEKYYDAFSREYPDYSYKGNPESQREVEQIKKELTRLFSGKNVLELACGTGFWTNVVAEAAKSVLATDLSNSMLDCARKHTKHSNVEFMKCDAYDLSCIDGYYDGGLANYFLSHVPRKHIASFLKGFHNKLTSGTTVFLADSYPLGNLPEEPLLSSDAEDRYAIRTLSDGTQHRIIKNYYSEEELDEYFSRHSKNLEIHIGKCFWWVSYRL